MFPYPLTKKKPKPKKKKLQSDLQKRVNLYKPYELNYAKDKIVSYSQFSTYKTCEYAWYLKHVAKKGEHASNIHFVFGNAMHETLQHYLKTMFDESGAAADRIDIINYFEEKMISNYDQDYKKYKKHFSTPEELEEFYQDGKNILLWFVKNRKNYFTSRKCELIGIELPLVINMGSNLYLKGYIDLAIYDQDLNKLTIYDIKTSTKGWGDYQKKDKTKIAQILLYKKYFSETYSLPQDNIDVKFFILKRKIIEESEFPQKRIQQFIPSSGKTSVKQADESFRKFLKDCFDVSGKPKERNYIKNVNEFSCKFCEFGDKPELCNKKNSLV